MILPLFCQQTMTTKTPNGHAETPSSVRASERADFEAVLARLDVRPCDRSFSDNAN